MDFKHSRHKTIWRGQNRTLIASYNMVSFVSSAVSVDKQDHLTNNEPIIRFKYIYIFFFFFLQFSLFIIIIFFF